MELLATSTFAFVPRGDAMFSYRLLEAMSFGCIAAMPSDNWVLPFDLTVDGSAIGLHLAENDIPALPQILRAFSPQRIAALQQGVVEAYRTRFGNLDLIVDTLFREIEIRMDSLEPDTPSHPN